MEAVLPVIEGEEHVIYGKGQPEFKPLPALLTEDTDGQTCVLTRWRLSPEERAKIEEGGDVFVVILSPKGQVFPMSLHATCPATQRKPERVTDSLDRIDALLEEENG